MEWLCIHCSKTEFAQLCTPKAIFLNGILSREGTPFILFLALTIHGAFSNRFAITLDASSNNVIVELISSLVRYP